MAGFAVRKSDAVLGLTVFGLTVFGLIMIYSASVIVGHTSFGDNTFFVKRQLAWAIVGSIGLLVMANIEYTHWKKLAAAMLLLTLILLMSIFILDAPLINGARRWVIIFGQSFQPSELAKLTFIIYLSAWLVQRKQKIGRILETFVPFIAVLGLISFLMLKQPDFGTLSIMLASAVAIYFVAGLTWKQVILGILLAVLGFVTVIMPVKYRRERVLTFLNPTHDTSGRSYHINNIAIAVGSGGWKGLGFGESKQKRLFLPEPYTDSIFAVIAEELGFVSAQFIMLVYLFLIYRGYLVAARAPDLFGRLLATGITTWLAFQTFINLGSMLHIVPLVGVPLPFVSFGGTNLVISLLAVGILLNISRHAVPKEDSDGKRSKRK